MADSLQFTPLLSDLLCIFWETGEPEESHTGMWEGTSNPLMFTPRKNLNVFLLKTTWNSPKTVAGIEYNCTFSNMIHHDGSLLKGKQHRCSESFGATPQAPTKQYIQWRRTQLTANYKSADNELSPDQGVIKGNQTLSRRMASKSCRE